jgi:hypothetical protein
VLKDKAEMREHIKQVLTEMAEDVQGFDVDEGPDNTIVDEVYETPHATFSLRVIFPKDE